MAGKQAKVLSRAELNKLLAQAKRSLTPEREKAIVLLTVFAGLRACEVAGLTWAMVTTGNGKLASLIDIHDGIAKKGSGRRLPMHPDLRRALAALATPAERAGFVIKSNRAGGKLRPNSIVNLYRALANAAGLEGCSSHSGRRTFITRAARSAHQAGASLRDIQLLVGHRSIETTQGYIDGDSVAQHRLVRNLAL